MLANAGTLKDHAARLHQSHDHWARCDCKEFTRKE